MEQGEFDNLAGAGQPIDLSENPYEDPDWRTAHRMLRHAGFAPAWIEERKDIDAELEAARISLARNWRILSNARDSQHHRSAQARWDKALEIFRTKVAGLNRRIDGWNLKPPPSPFHPTRINVTPAINQL